MKQKYFLIAGGIILFLLIILISIIGTSSKKTLPQTQSLNDTNKNIKALSNMSPTEFPRQERSTGEQSYAAFQNFIGILSGPSEPKGGPTFNPTQIPISSEEQMKKNELKSLENYAAFNNLLGIVFGQSAGSLKQSSFYPSDRSGSSSLTTKKLTGSSKPSELVYYSQCNGDYDTYLLPNGCNICKAGCGQTTAAMILSSYIDKKFTPSAVTDLYKQNGFTAGCKGSTVGDAQQILEMNGLKATDIIYYGDSSLEETTTDLRSYIKAGWTMFMLAKFCSKGCGHFFWIIDVDEDNNVWTYDPGYGNKNGKKIVPLNESSLNPPAKYYVAFGVKK